MDYIGDLLNHMSSAFNQETAIPKKEEISMDETLKWRALKNNQFASRTRLTQQQPGSAGSGTRSGLANGRKSVAGGTASGSTSNSRQQRRRTSGGSCNDSSTIGPAADDGSRSPTALLGDNGNLTPDIADEEDIEIEIAKDISGEELQEALGLSQLVEVESEEFGGGGTLVVEDRLETVGNGDEQLPMDEKKTSPTMENQHTEKDAETVAEDCKTEDMIDTKLSLEVPYSNSASASPTPLEELKDAVNEQLEMLPTKCDTSEPDLPVNNVLEDAVAAGGSKPPDVVESVELPSSAGSAQKVSITDYVDENVEEFDDVAKDAENTAMDDHVENDTVLPDLDDVSMLDDDEDDVLIINTDDADEVVELGETSKEDEEDEEETTDKIEPSENDDHATTTVEEPKADRAELKDKEIVTPESQPDLLAVEDTAEKNVADKVEEKFHPKQTADENKDEEHDHNTTERSSNDCDEVKFSDSLKPSFNSTLLAESDRHSPACEKVEEKTESMVEENKTIGSESFPDKEIANTSTEVSGEKAEQPAGRTTRSKKSTVGVGSTVNTSPPAGIAGTAHSQRRSQRFQKDATAASTEGKLNGENAIEPMVVVKEEETDESVAARKRASVGAAPGGDSKLKAAVKSDRSLRSKQQGNVTVSQPTVLTRRASETVKASPDDATDAQETDADKSIVGRRGRKRTSQDRSSVVSNDPVTRTKDKSTHDESVKREPTTTGQGRTSRSGFPLEPDETDTGGKEVQETSQQEKNIQQQQQQHQQQQPPQRRGRKRKNLNVSDKDNATASAASSTASSSGTANAEKPLLHPYKRAARQSRDGSDGILASALARRDKVNSQGRLSRQIKLSAKILANEELRQGYEQQLTDNGRITHGSEQSVAAGVHEDDLPVSDRDRHMEPGPEKQRKLAREATELSVASCSTIGSSTEDVTVVSVTLPPPKPGTSGTAAKRTSSDTSLVQQQPNKKLMGPSTTERLQVVKRVSKPSAQNAPSCPNVETFLQEVRSMRLGTNRSPEENRKLNRRQQKRMVKMKEKFMNSLSLRRRSAQQPRNGTDGDDFDVEQSVGESESSGSEADFVPSQKIGTVGKPSVTLRLRKPETLLENHTRKVTAPTGGRVPLVTVPKGASGMPKLNVNAGRSVASATAHMRQVGKPSNGAKSTTTNGSGGRVRPSSSGVVLPAAMTTLGARASTSKTVTSTYPTTNPNQTVSAMLKDKETEQLQRSLQRLGCEVTLIPTTAAGRTGDTRSMFDSSPVPGSSRPATNAWPLRRVKDTAVPQRPRSQQNAGTTPPILPGTTSPSLQIVLGNAGSPPVQDSSRLLSSRMASTASPSSDTLVCHCRNKSDIFVEKTVGNGFCTAIDDIDGQQIGCCNELSNDLPNMLRPSPRVSFQLLCNMHRKRLEDHGCCAICGRFCTQGNFAMCKNAHIFHPHCADKYMINTPYNPTRPEDYVAPTLVLKCPHCNQECPNREIEVNIQLTSPPVLLPSRKSIVKPAKMTVSKTGGTKANGVSGSTNVSESFRTTVKSLVPRSLKNMLSVDHGATNGGGGGGVNAAAHATTSSAGRISSAKDTGTAGTKNRFSAKDFSHAVCTKKDDALVSEIITSGFDIETRFREFHHGTCLHVVCNYGTLAMVYLIMCRARSVDYLNIVDRALRTAVMCAVMGSKCDIVKLLLDSGADATLKGPYGMTVLHLAAKLGQHEAVRTILACARQRLTARDLMAFVNAVDNGRWTALAWAAENRHKQTVEQLISIGADVNVCDRLNNTSLHWAALSGCSDTLYLLMTKDCNPNLQNNNGETPLHIACRQGHADICVVLLAMGASLNIRNTSNKLPQDTIENPNSECANIIAANVKMRNLSNNLKETHILCSDISKGRERHPIQVVYYTRGNNDRQLSVPNFKYIRSNVQIDSPITIDPDARSMPICSCVDSCTSAQSECLCSERTWYTNDGRLMNDFNYLDPPTVIECGDLCDCNRRLCRNRVVQHGLHIPLQLCYIPGKAWGVRTMLPIQKGNFLVEYVGEILSDEAANHRLDDSYLFDLGNGFCIDASAYGNVSRFFNHSCQPNVSPVSVYYDHKDQRHPRVALFACRDIEAQEEICFDYGEKFWMVKRGSLECRCNTAKCRYRQVE